MDLEYFLRLNSGQFESASRQAEAAIDAVIRKIAQAENVTESFVRSLQGVSNVPLRFAAGLGEIAKQTEALAAAQERAKATSAAWSTTPKGVSAVGLSELTRGLQGARVAAEGTAQATLNLAQAAEKARGPVYNVAAAMQGWTSPLREISQQIVSTLPATVNLEQAATRLTDRTGGLTRQQVEFQQAYQRSGGNINKLAQELGFADKAASSLHPTLRTTGRGLSEIAGLTDIASYAMRGMVAELAMGRVGLGSFYYILGAIPPTISLTTLGLGVMAAGLAGIAVKSVQAAASIEVARVAIGNLIKDDAKAGQVVAQLIDISSKSPFDPEILTRSAQRMLAMGIATDRLVPTMQSLVNAAAALGGSSETIDRLSLALGQMQAKARLSSQDMRQLAEAGIPAWDILAKKLQMTTGEVQKLAEQGMISGPAAAATIIEGMNTAFAGASEKFSHTFTGMWKQIAIEGKRAFIDIGDAISPVTKGITELILYAARGAREAIHTVLNPQELQSFLPGGAAFNAKFAAGQGFAATAFPQADTGRLIAPPEAHGALRALEDAQKRLAAWRSELALAGDDSEKYAKAQRNIALEIREVEKAQQSLNVILGKPQLVANLEDAQRALGRTREGTLAWQLAFEKVFEAQQAIAKATGTSEVELNLQKAQMRLLQASTNTVEWREALDGVEKAELAVAKASGALVVNMDEADKKAQSIRDSFIEGALALRFPAPFVMDQTAIDKQIQMTKDQFTKGMLDLRFELPTLQSQFNIKSTQSLQDSLQQAQRLVALTQQAESQGLATHVDYLRAKLRADQAYAALVEGTSQELTNAEKEQLRRREAALFGSLTQQTSMYRRFINQTANIFAQFGSGLFLDVLFPQQTKATGPTQAEQDQQSLFESLQKGAQTLAEKGYSDAGQRLADLVLQIQNAGTVAQANAIAIKYFGSSGVEMAAKIRAGGQAVKDAVEEIRKVGPYGKSSFETAQAAIDGTSTRISRLDQLFQTFVRSLAKMGLDNLFKRIFESTAMDHFFSKMLGYIEQLLVKLPLIGGWLGKVLNIPVPNIGIGGGGIPGIPGGPVNIPGVNIPLPPGITGIPTSIPAPAGGGVATSTGTVIGNAAGKVMGNLLTGFLSPISSIVSAVTGVIGLFHSPLSGDTGKTEVNTRETATALKNLEPVLADSRNYLEQIRDRTTELGTQYFMVLYSKLDELIAATHYAVNGPKLSMTAAGIAPDVTVQAQGLKGGDTYTFHVTGTDLSSRTSIRRNLESSVQELRARRLWPDKG